jgi:enterochelin esterase-like enzyme
MRGLCVIAMTVDHVAGPSPVYWLTGGNRFLTSAAEGFILISGLTAGLVYRRLVARDGLAAAARKALRRALTLYLLAVGLTLAIAPVSELFGLPWSYGLDFSHPLRFVVGALTLHQTYYLADAMLLYTLLLALLPLALWMLERGKARVLLVASGGLWLLHQFFPGQATVTWPIEGNYLFAFSAWQLLFFAALTFGYRSDRLPRLTASVERFAHALSAAAFALLIALYMLLRVPAAEMPPVFRALRPQWDTLRVWIELELFAKADLGPGRVFAAGVLFAFLFFTLTRLWPVVARPARVTLPLGQNALYAFALHAVVAVATAIALTTFAAPRDLGWLNASLQLTAVALIAILARRRVLVPTNRTRPVWQAAPFALAGVLLVLLPLLSFPSHSAPLAPVSEETLARARAYGTPVTEVEAAGLFAATPRAHSTPSVTATPASNATPNAGGWTGPRGLVSRSFDESSDRGATRTPGATKATSGAPANRAPRATATPVPAATLVATGEPTPEDPDDVPEILPADQAGDYLSDLSGQVLDRSFWSETLRREMRYWAYVPPGYGETAQRHPTLYMLHGGGGALDEWAAYGLLDAADRAFREGKLVPFIIVLPQGDKSFWTNWANDSPRWGDYLAYDVVWEIDSSFATIRAASARIVAGNSMGGWGALYQAFTHPDIFGAAAAHSPSLYIDEGAVAFLGTGEEYASKDPLSLSLLLSPELQLRLWLDIGDDDPWEPRAAELHERLDQRGIWHEWRVYHGIHGPEYWAMHVPEYLQFYGAVFAGRS